MPTIELTAFNVKNLKANQTRVDYFDRKITGFGLRVSGSGRKTWFLSYRKSGIKKRYSMGTYPIMPLAEARDKAREVLLRIQMGNDPSQDKAAERRAPTAEYLVNEYIEKYAKLKKRSWKKDEAILRGKFLPFFKCTKIHEIHRRDINTFLDSLLTEGLTTQCNRVFEIVRRMFNFAIEQDIIQHSPCFMVKKRVPEKRRDRVLTPNEIQAVWKALSTENDSIRHVFGILLHTGQRPNEVLSMEWRDLDLDSGWWKIPANKTKNGLSHRVPIQNFVYNILHSRKDNKSTWVFPNLQGREGHMINIYKAKRRIENHTGIFFNVYDFRRTVASMMTSFGISRLVVSKILNHVERGITSVYDRHSYDADKVAALSMWETRLGMIFSDLRAVTNTARVGQ